MGNLLNSISSPKDLKKLSEQQLLSLCREIREVLIDTVSQNGGHLASNLGVVELSVALHSIFDSPKDNFIFDVGHQSYVHKLLTGRVEEFSTIRTEGGLAGFPKPSESDHDPFVEGHCGTALSSAIGLAKAKLIKGDDSKTIVIMGDGSFTNGMIYEAVNNIDTSLKNLIVVLNDNSMSISKSVGSVARYLLKLRTNSGYARLKGRVETALKSVPVVGDGIAKVLMASKSFARRIIYDGVLFEELGFRYIGPVDGHDLPALIDLFKELSTGDTPGPMIIHAITSKGKGFHLAEENPGAYHGVGSFDLEKGNPDIAESDCFSNVFGKKLEELAAEDERICAVTAAMKYGTGLNFFAHSFPKRFFDVGIAEEHAVTFSAGLARGGMKPVFAVYSTFLQRSFDQLYHDIILNKSDFMLAVDRAGIVGTDGETHQGLFDTAILSSVGGFTVVSPSNYEELRLWAEKLMSMGGARAIRYPRGSEDKRIASYIPTGDDADLISDGNADNLIVTYGREFAEVMEAKDLLAQSGCSCDVMKLNVVWPLAEDTVNKIAQYKNILFAEEGVICGGIGEHLLRMLEADGYCGRYGIAGFTSAAVPHGTLGSALKSAGLDSNSLMKRILGSGNC